MRIVERLNELIGTKNWVVARRTKRILRKYGPDVVCLSSKRYEALWKQAVADRARADRRDQLKRDIQEFEDWCRQVQEQARLEGVGEPSYFDEICICGHKREQHLTGNHDYPESPCMATIRDRSAMIDGVDVIQPCNCDDFELEEPFEDREAWEHRYGQ